MMVKTMDEPEEGGRLGRIVLWSVLGVVGLMVALIAIGYTAAHLDRGTGEQVWRSRAVIGGPLLLVGIPTALLVYFRTRVPKGASEGERKEARTRRRFWGWVGASVALGMIMASTLQVIEPGASLSSSSALPPAVSVALSLIYLLVGGAATFVWYRRMDELEKEDNLWSGSIAATAVMIVYLPWFLLARARIVAEPSALAIFGLLLAVYTVTYLWRKARR